MFRNKALLFIESEIELLNLKIQHPEILVEVNPQVPNPDLHLIPKSNNLGIIGIAEIVVGLHLLGEIIGKDGKPIPLIRLASAFESIFGISFGDIYDKQDAIFRRKPYNLTKALDTLRNAILKEDRKRNNR